MKAGFVLPPGGPFLFINRFYRKDKKMGTRKTKVEARIEALCEHHGFSTAVVYWKAIKILGRYRDIRNMPVIVTKDSEQITEKTKQLIREKFFRSYVRKECAKTGSLDYILSDMLSIEYADEVIEAVFERMKKMGFPEDEYHPIIYFNYFHPTEMADDDIMLEIGLSRSSYYRKKKEGTILFGILLWAEMLERCELAVNL